MASGHDYELLKKKLQEDSDLPRYYYQCLVINGQTISCCLWRVLGLLLYILLLCFACPDQDANKKE